MIGVGHVLSLTERPKKLCSLGMGAHICCVMPHSDVFDAAKRDAEKQASRDADARALATGTKTREQLWFENDMFAGAESIVLRRPARAY